MKEERSKDLAAVVEFALVAKQILRGEIKKRG